VFLGTRAVYVTIAKTFGRSLTLTTPSSTDDEVEANLGFQGGTRSMQGD
jgi:hypothetical protein